MRNLLILFLSGAITCTVTSAEPVDYVRDVLPIFETYCIACHTEDEAQGGLVMQSHGSLMSGGENGLSITAGVPSSSRLFLMASGKMEPVMPPDDAQGPSEEELAVIAAWIEQGAAGPDGDMPIRRELRVPKIETAADAVLPITAIAMTDDASRRAIARYGVIDILGDDDAVIRSIQTDLGKVNSIRFSRDARRLLVASGTTGAFGVAAIFDVASGKQVTELVGHRDVLYAAEFSPDETMVATAGYDRDIILWDARSGEPIREFTGHNGAIFDLAFSPDGKVLVSGCADETAKVWNVSSGQRLDTLGQPEGEVFAVDVTDDGKFVIAGSADNRLRVWSLRSVDKPRTNPLIATRFIDESPLVNFRLTPDGTALVVLSEAGNVKVVRTADWNQAATLDPLGEMASDLVVAPDGQSMLVALMNGQIVRREIPSIDVGAMSTSQMVVDPVYLDLGEAVTIDETKIIDGRIPRGVVVTGTIDKPGQVDAFRWSARRGEVWAIDVDSVSKIDPMVSITDSNGNRVLRVRLQSIRDSYFTFRGKDSTQIGDFRMFNWEEMKLNDYLYAGGEVTRLFMHPRGPDSGFNVYPNEGSRWTYFGTSQATHALGEPAYVVRPLAVGQVPPANGLPVFDIYYENDDDPKRKHGSNSRLVFTAPADGDFTANVTDTRGEGGGDYKYKFTLRPADPSFTPSIAKIGKPLLRGSGREFTVRVDRADGFDGPVTFDVDGLPTGVVSNFPITVESGQRYAHGTLWVPESIEAWQGKRSATVIARADILGKRIERTVGSIGDLTIGDRPDVIPTVQPVDRIVASGEDWTLQVRRGETVSARVVLDRKEGFTKEVSLGKENAARNSTFGVYVDNIGLNGLLALAEMTEREFFITADPVAQPGKRTFFLTANASGSVTTYPITIEVLP